MQLDWQPVDSKRIVAEAYDLETETIYVRFKDGIEWYYEACAPDIWEAFTSPGQSRGQFISHTLNYKPMGRHG
ncbi:KTSC domain-containing protein [Rhodococcus opacus]|uniref:KTSC domain-containing protein n=1 Tax=Rhodococcus opacus TaxID=37919 RepID=UPI001C46A65D|nr:KTSC domain-containing protein [Rhodococcus opacus]MBV6762765.1 KTSC domain-containing protein [Rhodococcus opacus]